MLQQTQVERVISFYKKFLKTFPTAKALSKTQLADVLKAWQGLGYNRRAKFLHQAAKIIVKEGFPKEVEETEKLPGVGPYTAQAVAAFAYNRPEVFIETNIRTVFLYHCFPSKPSRLNLDKRLSDKEILPLVAKALKKSKMQPRDFYAALMDYGAYLKQRGVKLNSRSTHYTKQSKFEGSARQLRGHILTLLLQKPHTLDTMIYHSKRKPAEVKKELIRLQKENFISYKNKKFKIAK